MKRSQVVEYACGDLYVRLREEGEAYCVEYSKRLEEHCSYALLVLRERCISKEELAQRFGGADGFIEELVSLCPELERRASLSAVVSSLRQLGWVVHVGRDLVEAVFSRGSFIVEVRVKPVSPAFSELSAKVRTYPGSLQEALNLRYLLLSPGFRVVSLLPVVVASALEERVFNCSAPETLAALVEKVERVFKRY